MARQLRVGLALAAFGLAIAAATAPHLSATRQAGPIDASVFSELSWRPLGPRRAGRVTAATGVASHPPVFYVAVYGGGLWKTIDYGQSWRPIFDRPTGAVAAVAVAPSRPDTVYVGTGADGLSGPAMPGAGLFASTDAGRTWMRLALDAPGTITRIVVDPEDSDRLLVAVVETVVEPDAAAGVFQSIDGGRTFARVLTADARAGQLDLAIHPASPRTTYALADEGFFRSSDGGATWQPLTTSLPATGSGLTGRLAIAVTPARPDRLIVAIGTAETIEMHRSDDRGTTWSRVHVEPSPAAPRARVGVAIDPVDADVVFGADSLIRRSADGGQTWTHWLPAAEGTAAGEGADVAWIHPANPDVMLIGGRTGAAITVNRGETWSAPHTQASADIWALAADSSFPYRVCGPQRYGPAVCVPSFHEADAFGGVLELPAVSAGAAGRVAPDPGNADVFYLRHGSTVTRYDSRTGQMTPITPTIDGSAPAGDVDIEAFAIEPVEASRRAPLGFGSDSKTLYVADRTVWRSTNSGLNWTATGPEAAAPAPDGRRTAVITALEFSALATRTFWIGWSDGRVHVTRDAAATWTAVPPPAEAAAGGVVSVEASHFDPESAYLVLTAATPSVWRTRDAGATWVPVTRGLPAARVHIVREDALRRGLLFAGTDRGVSLSFDDGESWQALTLNLPAAPVRDLIVEDAHLLAATSGRGIWVLDDISPMRQTTADVLRAPAFIFRPATAWRVRARAAADLAAPAVPADLAEPERGPPPGRGGNEAALDYLIGPEAPAVLTLEIIATASGEHLRRFTSEAPAGSPDWLDPTPGLHRRMWDLRYSAVPPAESGVPPVPGLRVPAGAYQVRLTADGRPLRQAVSIRLDPRVRASASDLAAHFALAKVVDDTRRVLAAARAAGEAVSPAEIATAASLDALARTLDQFDGRPSAAIEAAVAAALE